MRGEYILARYPRARAWKGDPAIKAKGKVSSAAPGLLRSLRPRPAGLVEGAHAAEAGVPVVLGQVLRIDEPHAHVAGDVDQDRDDLAVDLAQQRERAAPAERARRGGRV